MYMLDNYLLKGVCIGILFGVPVGVVGMITIQRTLAKGVLAGVITGIGSSFADVIYASISVFGMELISNFLLKHQRILCVLGCMIMIYTAIKIMKNNALFDTKNDIKVGNSFLTTFMITLTSPATILSFMVVFTMFGVSGDANFINKGLLISGIFIGTGWWWVVLSIVTKHSQKLFSNRNTTQINNFFGIMIILLAIGIGTYSLMT